MSDCIQLSFTLSIPPTWQPRPRRQWRRFTSCSLYSGICLPCGQFRLLCATIVYQNGGLYSRWECITAVVSGVRGAVAGCGHYSDGRSVSDSTHCVCQSHIHWLHPTQTACHVAPPPLTTIDHCNTLQAGVKPPFSYTTHRSRATVARRALVVILPHAAVICAKLS